MTNEQKNKIKMAEDIIVSYEEALSIAPTPPIEGEDSP